MENKIDVEKIIKILYMVFVSLETDGKTQEEMAKAIGYKLIDLAVETALKKELPENVPE